MKPIGPLMWEHRLIEWFLHFFEDEIHRITNRKEVDPVFIDTAVDFIRTYDDRTHHGKEEDILFRDLAKKTLSLEHTRIMIELVEEHTQARKMVGRLIEAKDTFLLGTNTALSEIIQGLNDLAAFYPRHIEKEDKHFFFPCMAYFDKLEQGKMLQEFWEFDRKMIHEKYRKVLETLDKREKIVKK
jgi:hemerythrin-like domain-containing protein